VDERKNGEKCSIPFSVPARKPAHKERVQQVFRHFDGGRCTPGRRANFDISYLSGVEEGGGGAGDWRLESEERPDEEAPAGRSAAAAGAPAPSSALGASRGGAEPADVGDAEPAPFRGPAADSALGERLIDVIGIVAARGAGEGKRRVA